MIYFIGDEINFDKEIRIHEILIQDFVVLGIDENNYM